MDISHLTGAAGAAVAINLGIKVTLLIVLGWCASRALHGAPSGVRHLVWLSVIVGSLLIPALSRVASVRVAVLPGEPARAGTLTTASGPAVEFAPAPTVGQAPTSQVFSGQGAAQPVRPSLGALAIAAWLAGFAAVVAWLVAGLASIRRILRRARVVDSADWHGALADAARRLRLGTTPRLVISDDVETAFACHALAPTIVLPRSADAWSYEQRRTVLLHELAHIRRLDLVGHAVATVAAAVYWFHPLVWLAARRLRAESERACDELVLDSGVRPSDYAQHLLDLATAIGHRHGAPTLALPIVRPREFEGRVVAILERAFPRPPVGRGRVLALVGLFGFLTTSIAAVVPVPKTQPPPVATHNVLAASTTPVSAPVAPASSSSAIPGASVPRVSTIERGAVLPALPHLELRLAPCDRVNAGREVPLLVDTAFHRLFDGIALAPAEESKACTILLRLYHEQIAEDSMAAVSLQSDREKASVVQTQRDAALRALLTNDVDRAAFDAHAVQASAGRGGRGRSGGPPVDWAGIGGSVGGGGGGRGAQRAAGDTSAMIGGGRGGRGRAPDSSVKDLKLTLESIVSNLTYRRLFEGITLSPEQEASARGIIAVAQQAMPAPIPPANRVRLRIAPVAGVVTMQATSAAELVALIGNDADRATVQSRIITPRVLNIR